MNVMLIRVAADLSRGGGRWNGPVDSTTNEFVYVAIPENSLVHAGFERPYSKLEPVLARFGVVLPDHLRARNMHLGPDFDHLTYGDAGQRGQQIREKLRPGDLMLFYSGLRDINRLPRLVYAIIGLFEIESFINAVDVSERDRDINAHSRRVLSREAADVIVKGRPERSGRLERCLPIGEYRHRAYRLKSQLIEEWGHLSSRDGYIQRSVRPPVLLDPSRCLRWIERKQPILIRANN